MGESEEGKLNDRLGPLPDLLKLRLIHTESNLAIAYPLPGVLWV